MIEFPSTVQELLANLAGNVVFLGAVSSLITGAIWRWIANPPENWKRLISLIIPFIIAFIAFAAELGFGYVTNWDENTVYGLFILGAEVAFGKQLMYTAYHGIKSATVGHENRAENETVRDTDALEK